jgi:hypothetical protein
MERPTNIRLNTETKAQIQKKSDDRVIYPDIKKGEIVLANIFYKNKTGTNKIEMVYKRPSDIEGYYSEYFCMSFKKRTNNSVDKIFKIEIIVRTGFENTNKGFTVVNKSEETRNKITGNYE